MLKMASVENFMCIFRPWGTEIYRDQIEDGKAPEVNDINDFE